MARVPHASGERRIPIAILNDFDIVVRGLAEMLSAYDDIDVVDTSTGEVSLDRTVDVALYDTYGRQGMPWMELHEMLASSRARHVAVFTFSFDERLVRQALDAGVDGYLWKGSSADELADAIRRIAAGDTVVMRTRPRRTPPTDRGYRWPFAEAGLSARESEVLALVTEGLTNAQIAESLYVGAETVKSHVKSILRKLGVRSRVEAAALASQRASFARQTRSVARRERATGPP